MTNCLPPISKAFSVGLTALALISRTLLAEHSTETLPPKSLTKFAGVWQGSFTHTNWGMDYPMILEIQPAKGHEINVRLEWPLFRSRTSGSGIATSNSVSWTELERLSGTGVDIFGRYIAVLTTNNELKGKYFTEGTLEGGDTFTLKKTDPEALNHFRAKNAKAVERLRAASRNIDFLDPAWRKIVPSAVRWLDETLGYDFWVVDDTILPDVQYADDLSAALEKRENLFALKSGSEIPLWLNAGDERIKSYRISLPRDFPSDKKYPLLIDLHGAGIRPNHFVEANEPGESPFVVVKPQSYGFWRPETLNVMFAEMKTILPVDEDRVYLQGSSMGGAGTYRWAMANPELFAAIAPMCAANEVFRASRLKNVPTWIFHGEKDTSVPFWFAERMLNALQDCGAEVKYTFFPEAKHSLRNLIDNNALRQWYLEHKRSSLPHPPDPVESITMGSDDIGEKKIVSLPAQRFASIQIKSGQQYRADSRLYEVFQRAGVRSRGILQEQILPSHPEGTNNLVLAIPKELEIKELPEGVTITEASACRALSFAIGSREKSHVNEAIASVKKELKARGETPTGEIRKTLLTSFEKFIQRIDLILQ